MRRLIYEQYSFLHENITSMPRRNINHVLTLFSLTNELEMTINGKYHQLSNHIAIINQGDLYQINKGRNLIELKIPMAYFYLEDATFLIATLMHISCNQVILSNQLF